MFYFSIKIKLKTKLKLSISPIIFVSTFNLYSKVPEPSIFMANNFSLIKRKSVQSLINSGEILLEVQTKIDLG